MTFDSASPGTSMPCQKLSMPNSTASATCGAAPASGCAAGRRSCQQRQPLLGEPRPQPGGGPLHHLVAGEQHELPPDADADQATLHQAVLRVVQQRTPAATRGARIATSVGKDDRSVSNRRALNICGTRQMSAIETSSPNSSARCRMLACLSFEPPKPSVIQWRYHVLTVFSSCFSSSRGNSGCEDC